MNHILSNVSDGLLETCELYHMYSASCIAIIVVFSASKGIKQKLLGNFDHKLDDGVKFYLIN